MKKTSATLGAVQCRVFVGGNKRGDDATLVLGQFSPLVDKRSKQGAGPVGRDTSGGTLVRASPSLGKGHWALGSEMGSPRIYLVSFFALLSIINLLAAQEVKSKQRMF